MTLKYRVHTLAGPEGWPPVHDVYVSSGVIWTGLTTGALWDFEQAARRCGTRYDGPWTGAPVAGWSTDWVIK